MSNEIFTIPTAIQLVMDDVGWFYGRNERELGGPTRTGISRQHTLEDYIVIEELGRAINQKINAMLVIGEWDHKHILKDVPYATPKGKEWSGSFWFEPEKARDIRDFLNSSSYIELGYHGLLHDAWSADGEFLCGKEFVVPRGYQKGNPLCLAPEEIIRMHFDAFLEIYNDWGFSHELRTFAAPGGPVETWKTTEFSDILKDYGIKFWHNNSIVGCSVRSGIILNPKAIEICPWEVYDLDPLTLPVYPAERAGILGSHWANYLRFNPQRNCDRISDWKIFFNRLSEEFGMIISRDIKFAHYQQLYRAYSKVSSDRNLIRIDLSEARRIAPETNVPLYISIDAKYTPEQCLGGQITLYEEKVSFNNYRIDRITDNEILIRLSGNRH